MNTQTENLTLAIIAALLSVKPSLKVDENLTNALQSAIDTTLPSQDLSETVRDDFSKACRAKGLLHDTFKLGLIHVPDSQLQSKTGSHAALIPAHDVTIDLPVTLDTVYRLATQVINLTTRLTPSECKVNLHNPAIGRIALDTILGNLAATGTTATASKDYPSLATKMGLACFTLHTHTGYGVDGYDQHRDDNSAISIYIKVDKADTVETVMQAKKGGTFIYKSENGLNYDIVPTNVVEGRQVVAVKYRFTLTKV